MADLNEIPAGCVSCAVCFCSKRCSRRDAVKPADLTATEISSIIKSLGGPALVATSKSETCRMLAELIRHRATIQWIEAWITGLESYHLDACTRPHPREIAAQLRRIMKGA